jgi:hypothetical protein
MAEISLPTSRKQNAPQLRPPYGSGGAVDLMQAAAAAMNGNLNGERDHQETYRNVA